MVRMRRPALWGGVGRLCHTQHGAEAAFSAVGRVAVKQERPQNEPRFCDSERLPGAAVAAAGGVSVESW